MKKRKKINEKLEEIGQLVGLNRTDVIKAKRTTKNIITMVLFAGVFMLLGNLMMPGGPVGLYYTGISIKDFKILFGGFF